MPDLPSPEICLALISREGAVLQAFRSFFGACGVGLFHAPSVSELFRTLPETRVNGMIADIPVLVRASAHEKLLYEGLEGIFPNVRVNWNAKAGFKVLFADPARSGEENLKTFLDTCLGFEPRTLRKNDRKPRNLNVLIRGEGEDREKGRRAFTLDISRGGVFVCTCDPPEAGATLELSVLELGAIPFRVSVRWVRPWGKATAPPGFGARFDELSEEQKERLHEILL